MRVRFEDFLREQGFHAEAIEFAAHTLSETVRKPTKTDLYRDAVSRTETALPPGARPEKKHLLP
ncbi:MAG: hypothetical protein AAF493_17090 [Pseudomonadota bacterium]